MRPDIFGLLQSQSNALTNTALYTSQQQDDSGVSPGVFDALMTEYVAREVSPPQEVQHSENISQPITTFRAGTSFPNIIANDESEQPLPENVNDDRSDWRNLFAQSRRLNVQRRVGNAMPESDFDAGVVEVVPDEEDSQPADNPATNEPTSPRREIFADMAERFARNPESVKEPASVPTRESAIIESVTPENHIAEDNAPEREVVTVRDNAPEHEAVITRDNVPEREAVNMQDNAPENEAVIARDNVPENEAVIARDNVPENEAVIARDNVPEHEAVITEDNTQEIPPHITNNDAQQITYAPETLPEITHNAETQPEMPPITPQIMKAANILAEALRDDSADTVQPARNLVALLTAGNDAPIMQDITPANIVPENYAQERTEKPEITQATYIAETLPENQAPQTQPVMPDFSREAQTQQTQPVMQEFMREAQSQQTQPVMQEFLREAQSQQTQPIMPKFTREAHTPQTQPVQPTITPKIMRAVDVLANALNDDTADITQPALNLVGLITAENKTPITQNISPVPDNDSPERINTPQIIQAIHAPEILPEISQPTRTPEITREIHTPQTPTAQPRITPEIMKATETLADALNDDSQDITQPALNLVALLLAGNETPITPDITPIPENDAGEYIAVNDRMNDTQEFRAVIAGDNVQEIQPHIMDDNAPEISRVMNAHETTQQITQTIDAPTTPIITPETPQITQTIDAPTTPIITPDTPQITQIIDAPTTPIITPDTPQITQTIDAPTTPEITQTDAPNYDGNDIQSARLMNAYTPENDAPITPEDSRANIVPEIHTQESRAEITPNDSTPPAPRTISPTPRKPEIQPAMPRITPEITQAASIIAEAVNNGDTDIRQPAQELVSLITETINAPDNYSPVSIDSPVPEITQDVNPPEAPRVNREAIAPDDDSPEITHDPLNMAEIFGNVAGVQVVAQESSTLTRNDSDTQEIHAPLRTRPQTSRTESPRMTRESHSGITETESDSHDDSAPITFTRNETGHDSRNDDSAGHDSRNDSHAQDSSAQVQTQNTRSNNATTRATRQESPRQANERTTPTRIFGEAHNDFASFFDGAIRTRRTASRTPAQPLSLRTAEYTPTRPGIVREGIINTVRFIRADGIRKANIIIDPPALGRISVELVSSSSGVEASVKVASEQIRQIVQEQITQLRDNLSQQGVQVSEFTVDVQQDSTGQGQNSGHEDRRSPYSFTAPENDDDAEEFRIDLEDGLLYWVA